MNLQPRARKVKFRLKFNQVEISNIQELKKHFNPECILQSIENGQFFRWLEYLGEMTLLDELKQSSKHNFWTLKNVFYPELKDCTTIECLRYWILSENEEVVRIILTENRIPITDVITELKSSSNHKKYFEFYAQMNEDNRDFAYEYANFLKEKIPITDVITELKSSSNHKKYFELYAQMNEDNRDFAYEYANFLKENNDEKWIAWMSKAAALKHPLAEWPIAPIARWPFPVDLRRYFPSDYHKSEIVRYLDKWLKLNRSNSNNKIINDLFQLLNNAAKVLKYMAGENVFASNIERFQKLFIVDSSNNFYIENEFIRTIILMHTNGKNEDLKSRMEYLATRYRPAWLLYKDWNAKRKSVIHWSYDKWPAEGYEDIRNSNFTLYSLGEKIAFVISGIPYRMLYNQ